MRDSAPSALPLGSPEEARKTVLVIEDNVLNRRLFEAMLTAEGYRVLEAQDGPSGLQRAKDTIPDLIVLDVNLPGLSGREVRRRLRESADTRLIPILLATADPQESIEREIQGSEYDGYMEKPIAVSEFLALADWLILRSQIARHIVV